MTIQTVDYSKIDEVSEDGIRLFKVMMRLEFALKEGIYATAGRGDVVEIDWDRFANQGLGSDFFERVRGAQELEVMLSKPPQRQIKKENGGLDWQEVSPVANVQEMVGAMRRVRNNLFHGGKSGDPDSDRNESLYIGALYLIDEILKSDDILATHFSGQL